MFCPVGLKVHKVFMTGSCLAYVGEKCTTPNLSHKIKKTMKESTTWVDCENRIDMRSSLKSDQAAVLPVGVHFWLFHIQEITSPDPDEGVTISYVMIVPARFLPLLLCWKPPASCHAESCKNVE